jgi:hypothetical protein
MTRPRRRCMPSYIVVSRIYWRTGVATLGH